MISSLLETANNEDVSPAIDRGIKEQAKRLRAIQPAKLTALTRRFQYVRDNKSAIKKPHNLRYNKKGVSEIEMPEKHTEGSRNGQA